MRVHVEKRQCAFLREGQAGAAPLTANSFVYLENEIGLITSDGYRVHVYTTTKGVTSQYLWVDRQTLIQVADEREADHKMRVSYVQRVVDESRSAPYTRYSVHLFDSSAWALREYGTDKFPMRATFLATELKHGPGFVFCGFHYPEITPFAIGAPILRLQARHVLACARFCSPFLFYKDEVSPVVWGDPQHERFAILSQLKKEKVEWHKT